MKRGGDVFTVVCIFAVFQAGLAFSGLYEFGDINNTGAWIDNSGFTPPSNGWFYLDFPDGGSPADYGMAGIFEYDDVVSDLLSFNITLTGDDDNSSSAIDIFLSFTSDHSDEQHIASYNVGTYAPFTLTMDMLNLDLLYNGTVVGDLDMSAYGGIDPFVGVDGFWVGYGCHFTHKSTCLELTAMIPEPCSLALISLGSLVLRKKR
ncbi:MAG: hypothetical protein JW912_04590 [Sedimentisphaerales bacterium]|nr:hypothetical protein [Sedimentisphaerales bacterium]